MDIETKELKDVREYFRDFISDSANMVDVMEQQPDDFVNKVVAKVIVDESFPCHYAQRTTVLGTAFRDVVASIRLGENRRKRQRESDDVGGREVLDEDVGVIKA
ncbi:hypothetical protein B9Z65_76 [Elsinoe australis]|uniref:Uncharacterized protein n=1 Tax=Elsinoe australis TaxID=40998 RepID=A0A2P7ZKC3_9PEZI|nr:hypothetical protein B9Z65_76 [Elsinoe australis]